MIFRLKDCLIDTNAYEVRRNGEAVSVEPQVFDLLILLIEKRDRLVTKDEIIDRIWQGRVISEAALNSRIKSARQAIGDSGASQKLIRTIRGRGFRFVGEVDQGIGSAPLVPLAWPANDRPAVAVVPFDLVGNEARHAAGMAEEIAAALLRLRWMAVSTPDRARYRLHGKVRGDGLGRLRVTILLSDALTGRLLWADHRDGRRDNAFAWEESTARRVAQAIEPALCDAEIERASRTEPDQLDAWGLAMRALPGVMSYRAGPTAAALEFLERAMELAPGDALPLSLAAWCHGSRGCLGFTASPKQEKATAHALAGRAALLNKGDALTETMLAIGYTLGNDLTAATMHADRALVLNGGSAWAWGRRAWINTFRGEAAEAIERVQIARRLAPVDPVFGASDCFAAAASYFQAGRYGGAIRWLERGIAERPDGIVMAPFFLASAYARENRKAEAERTLAQWKHLHPDLTVAQIRSCWPFNPQFLDRVAEGLESAGLPNRG